MRDLIRGLEGTRRGYPKRPASEAEWFVLKDTGERVDDALVFRLLSQVSTALVNAWWESFLQRSVASRHTGDCYSCRVRFSIDYTINTLCSALSLSLLSLSFLLAVAEVQFSRQEIGRPPLFPMTNDSHSVSRKVVPFLAL